MNDQMARLWVKHMRQYESAPPQKTTMQLWNEFLAAWRMLFGGNKRHLENDSRERQRELDVFWWTRNMSESDALRFVCESNGGLLSGASFEKETHLIAQMKVEGLPRFISESTRRHMFNEFLKHPNLEPERFVWQ